MVGVPVQRDILVPQVAVDLFQGVQVLDLNGEVVEAELSLGDGESVLGSLEQGQVVVDLAAGEEGAGGAGQGDFKPQDFGVELGGSLDVLYVQDQVTNALGFRHLVPP